MGDLRQLCAQRHIRAFVRDLSDQTEIAIPTISAVRKPRRLLRCVLAHPGSIARAATLARNHRQQDVGSHLLLMKDHLLRRYPFGPLAKGLAGVEVPVEVREIA